MTLLKLVYISHGWYLEIYKSPLFRNRIEAWKFGPVIPDLYNAFRPQGVNVSQSISVTNVRMEQDDESLLQEVAKIYGHMDAFQLSAITHEVGGPWDIATKESGYFAAISNVEIAKHYEQRRTDALNRADAE